MLWSLCSVAFAGDLILALKVTGPDGRVALQDELPLPADRMVPSPDQKATLAIHGAMFDSDGAVVELSAGPTKDGKVKVVKVSKSFELDAWIPKTETVVYKKVTWTIEASVGEVWSAAPPAAVTDEGRYVLAWDDAPLVKDPKKLEDPKLQKNAKKLAEVTAAETLKKRELPEGRSDAFTQASPMKYVEVYGEKQLVLDTAPVDGGHCLLGSPLPEGSPPQVTVPVQHLVPHVTSRELVGKLEGGTGYRVAAGVPLVEEGEGTWRVTTGGLSFLVNATKEDLAFFYKPSPHFENPPEPLVTLPAGTVGKTALGDVTWAGPDPLPVAAMQGVANPIATLRVPCAEVKVSPDTSAFVR
jgi:hypothetical protein